MPRKTVSKARGVYEKVAGSGVWWIRYKNAGVLRRERVGSKSNAIKLYQLRRGEIQSGAKLPAHMKHRGLKLAQIGKEAVDWYVSHGRKDLRTFSGRMKMIVADLGDRIADDIRPSDIDSWLGAHNDWTAATKNRYKTVLSKMFQIALIEGKVRSNPARLVAHRAENNRRIRYLLPEEEARLREAIERRCPEQLPAFVIAINTGMRKGEQFSLEWAEISLARRRIYLNMTKNGSSREIPMNKTCLKSFERLYAQRPDDGLVFQASRYRRPLQNPRKWFDSSLDDARIKNFRWHDLRHTFISRLVMAGVDLRTVQELAGHKSISMTVRYAHLAPEHNQAAIEKLDEP